MQALAELLSLTEIPVWIAQGQLSPGEIEPSWIRRMAKVEGGAWYTYIHLISDVIVGICYLIVPIIMLVFARHKRDFPFPRVFALVAASLLFCGATQFIDVLVAQWHLPRLDTFLRVVAAIISVFTVVVLIKVLPMAVELKGPKQLQTEIDNRTQELMQLTDELKEEAVNRELVLQDLEENRELLRLAMHYSNTGFFSWDLQSNRISFDQAAANMIGLPEGVLSVELDQFVSRIAEEYREQTKDAGVRAIEKLDEFVVRYPYQKSDTEEIWISGRGRAISDKEGKVKKIIGLHQDVTELVHRERELDLQAAAARKANDLKTKFIAQVSHEIRTPLAAMLGGLDTLLMSNEIDNCREVLSVVRSQGELLQVLVNDVLDLSKIEMGKINYDAKPTLVANVISDVWSLMNPLASEKGVTIEWIAETKLPEKIICDHLRLKQIFVNLISNAIKFTEHGSVTVVCKVDSSEIDHHYLVVEVRDCDGVPEDANVDEVFGEFERVDQFRSGYGFGLAICKRLVEIMGGNIAAKHLEGVGSTFIVRIPIGSIAQEELIVLDNISISIKRFPKTKYDLQQLPLKVLAAEDTRAIQFVLRKMIGSMVSDFTIADNGRIAYEETMKAEATEAPYDLVLMDVQMPELDGIEATRRLRLQGFDKPIIALTAGAMDTEKQACLAAGCTHFLAKPIDLRELRRLMQKICLEKTEVRSA